MKTFKIEMISREPRSKYRFNIWQEGVSKSEVIREVNDFYRPIGFEVDEGNVTDIPTNAELKDRFGVEQNDL